MTANEEIKLNNLSRAFQPEALGPHVAHKGLNCNPWAPAWLLLFTLLLLQQQLEPLGSFSFLRLMLFCVCLRRQCSVPLATVLWGGGSAGWRGTCAARSQKGPVAYLGTTHRCAALTGTAHRAFSPQLFTS